MDSTTQRSIELCGLYRTVKERTMWYSSRNGKDIKELEARRITTGNTLANV